MELSEQQKECLSRLESTDDPFLVIGYAGSGKSTAIFQHIERRLAKGDTVVCTSFTNKAVKVLKRIGEAGGWHPRLHFMTLHRALGLDIDDERQCETHEVVAKAKLLVVDECSMLTRWMVEKLESLEGPRVVYLGDPCQLFPVEPGKTPKLSKSFEVPQSYTMSQVLRQKGPLLDWISNARQALLEDELFDPQPDGVVHSCQGSKEDYDRWAKEFAGDWAQDPDRFRLICYHKRTVRKHIKEIRKRLFNDPQDFEPGELIVCRKPVFRMVETEEGELRRYTAYTTSEELVIESVEPVEKGNIKGWRLKVDGPTEIRAVSSESQTTYDRILNALKRKKSALWYEKEKAANCGDWGSVRELKEQYWIARDAITRFESQWDIVQQGYVLGVHISQGSTFDRGVVDASDFEVVLGYKSGNQVPVYNRCWYVAASRFRSGFEILQPEKFRKPRLASRI